MLTNSEEGSNSFKLIAKTILNADKKSQFVVVFSDRK